MTIRGALPHSHIAAREAAPVTSSPVSSGGNGGEPHGAEDWSSTSPLPPGASDGDRIDVLITDVRRIESRLAAQGEVQERHHKEHRTAIGDVAEQVGALAGGQARIESAMHALALPSMREKLDTLSEADVAQEQRLARVAKLARVRAGTIAGSVVATIIALAALGPERVSPVLRVLRSFLGGAP